MKDKQYLQMFSILFPWKEKKKEKKETTFLCVE